MVVDTRQSDATLSGLDALELAGRVRTRTRAARLWSGTWPKLAAIALALLIWQVAVWLHWKPDYLLPSPIPVFTELGHAVLTGDFWSAVATTMRRAVVGFALAAVIGFVLGVVVARSRVLRAALGSMITALQTMPSIAWFPLAMLLYGVGESAILFVIILGAAPSIANGVLTGVDYVPPLLVRAGRNMGARGVSLYRFVIAPASLPAIVAGLKQGWAFAWRSLMAGELLVIIADRPALGVRLDFARQFIDSIGLIGNMIVILVIGLVVDAVFGAADRAIRRRWGLGGDAA
jgi:NitT/TauT family transport system permease protein